MTENTLTTGLTDFIEAAKNGDPTDQHWELLIKAANGAGPANEGIRQWLGKILHDNLNPRQMANITTNLAHEYGNTTTPTNWESYQANGGTDDYPTWAAQHDQTYNQRMHALGVVFATGTQAFNDADATVEAERYTRYMTNPTTDLESVVGLSLLFSHGEYHTTFTTGITQDMINYENTDTFLGNWPATTSYPGPGLPTPTGPRTDPMVGLMDMLAKNPDAAQQAFAPPEPGSRPLYENSVTIGEETIFVNPTLAHLLHRN